MRIYLKCIVNGFSGQEATGMKSNQVDALRAGRRGKKSEKEEV